MAGIGIHCPGSRFYPNPSKNGILSSFSGTEGHKLQVAFVSSFNSVLLAILRLYPFCPSTYLKFHGGIVYRDQTQIYMRAGKAPVPERQPIQ